MVRIIYNDVELDIDPAQDLFWSIASTDLSNLSVREGGYNNTWQLPNTQRNREAFGMITEVDGNLDAAFVFRDVRVYDGNTLVLVGIGRVVDIRLDAIGLLVVSSVGGLGERLDALRADEVVLGENTATEITNVPGALLAWPVQASGLTAGFLTEGSTVPNVVWPWANLRALSHKILEQLGYTVDDDSPDAAETNTYIGGLYRAESEAALELRGQARANGQTFTGAGTVIGTDYLVDTTTIIGSSAFVSGAYNPVGRPIVNIKASLQVEFTAPPVVNTITLAVLVRNAARIIGYKQLLLTSLGTPVTYKLDFDIDCELAQAFDGGTSLYYRVLNQTSAGYTVNILQTSQWEVTPLDIMGLGITLRSITDVTPKDVVFEYLNRYQKLILVDETTRTVRLRKINVLQNKPNAKDWNAKLCVPEEAAFLGPYESSFVYGELARRNLYTHANNIGDGVIITETTTGENERNAFESPFSVFQDLEGVTLGALAANTASPTWNAKVVNDQPVQWRYWNVSRSYAVGNIVLNIFVRDFYRCVNANTGNQPDPTDSDWVRIKYDEVYSSREGVSQIATVLTWDVPAILNFPVGIISYEFGGNVITETKYQQVQFSTQFWQPLLNTYAAPITSALTRPRVDKYYIALNEADIANLDFSRPIYLNGSYYYIVLIDQYDVINKTPTPVVLLRLI